MKYLIISLTIILWILVYSNSKSKPQSKDVDYISHDSCIISFGGLIGVDQEGEINTIQEFQGELYVGGYYSSMDGKEINHLSKWNGMEWESINAFDSFNENEHINDLAIYKSNLIIAGSFDSIGNIQANGIAMYDGKNWEAININNKRYESILDLYVRKENLYIIGYFDELNGENVPGMVLIRDNKLINIARDLEGQITSVLETEEGLVVAGGFGPSRTFNVFRLVGDRWEKIGGEFKKGGINDLDIFNGELIASGTFESVDESQTYGVAKWNGQEWEQLGEGLLSMYYGGAKVELYQYNKKLIAAGGYFNIISTPSFIDNRNYSLAIWDGKRWRYEFKIEGTANEIYGAVNDIGFFQGDLIIAGSYSTIDLMTNKGINNPNPIIANGIAAYDENRLQAIGNGHKMSYSSLIDMTVHDSTMYFIGQGLKISDGDNHLGRNMIQWIDKTWSSEPLILADILHTIASFDSVLYVGSRMAEDDNGGFAMNHIVWNGKNLVDKSSGISGDVYAYEKFHDNLYIGGEIDHIGQLKTGPIARRGENGWEPLLINGEGIIYDLIAFEDTLYVAGAISFSKKDSIKYGILKFDGKNWSVIEGAQNITFRHLEVHEGRLYGLGDYMPTKESDDQKPKLVEIRGNNIIDLFETLNINLKNGSTINALVSYNNSLYFSGRILPVEGAEPYEEFVTLGRYTNDTLYFNRELAVKKVLGTYNNMLIIFGTYKSGGLVSEPIFGIVCSDQQ